MDARPIVTRKEAARLIGVTLAELGRMEDAGDDIIRAAGVRTTFHGQPSIRYRRVALLAWLDGTQPERNAS